MTMQLTAQKPQSSAPHRVQQAHQARWGYEEALTQTNVQLKQPLHRHNRLSASCVVIRQLHTSSTTTGTRRTQCIAPQDSSNDCHPVVSGGPKGEHSQQAAEAAHCQRTLHTHVRDQSSQPHRRQPAANSHTLRPMRSETLPHRKEVKNCAPQKQAARKPVYLHAQAV